MRVSHPNCGGESDLNPPPNLRDRPECRTGAVNERCIQSRSNNYSPSMTCFLNRIHPSIADGEKRREKTNAREKGEHSGKSASKVLLISGNYCN